MLGKYPPGDTRPEPAEKTQNNKICYTIGTGRVLKTHLVTVFFQGTMHSDNFK